MTDTAVSWSPADNPQAIAVAEAQWWERAAQLAVARLEDPDDDRISWFSSRQIDARMLVVALAQLLNAVRLVHAASADPRLATARNVLEDAQRAYLDSLPGVKHMRDALTHYDEWAQGKGRGPQKEQVKTGRPPREVAAMFWGFSYDPTARTISLGPYVLRVAIVVDSVSGLTDAIYAAALAVDHLNAIDMKSRIVEMLTEAKGECGIQDVGLNIAVDRGRALLSMPTCNTVTADQRRERTELILGVLTRAGIKLTSLVYPNNTDIEALFASGQTLVAE